MDPADVDAVVRLVEELGTPANPVNIYALVEALGQHGGKGFQNARAAVQEARRQGKVIGLGPPGGKVERLVACP
jgi:hypothetical protein